MPDKKDVEEESESSEEKEEQLQGMQVLSVNNAECAQLPVWEATSIVMKAECNTAILATQPELSPGALITVSIVKDQPDASVGIGLDVSNDRVVISSIKNGSLASKTNLQVGMTVKAVNNVDCSRKELNDVAKLFADPSGNVLILAEVPYPPRRSVEGDSTIFRTKQGSNDDDDDSESESDDESEPESGGYSTDKSSCSSEDDDSEEGSLFLASHPALDLVARLVSNDTTLTEIAIDAASIANNTDHLAQTLQIARHIADALQRTSYLTKLTLKGCWDESSLEGVLDVLLTGLSKNASIKDLVLDQNPRLDRHAASTLGRSLANHKRLKRLTISQCQFTSANETRAEEMDGSGLVLLLMGLQHSKTIKGLSLRHVDLERAICSDAVASCVSLLQLESLQLYDTHLNHPNDLAFVLDHVQQTNRLTNLDLSHNYLGQQGIELLARCLSSGVRSKNKNQPTKVSTPQPSSPFASTPTATHIKTLTLVDCGLVRSSTLKTLTNALRDNTTLQSLNLNQNAFGDKGARRLQQLLANSNRTLLSLHLVGCGVSASQLTEISNQLRYNNSFLKSMFNSDVSLAILDGVRVVERFAASPKSN